MRILAHTHAVIIAWGTVTENTCSWLAEPVQLPAGFHIPPPYGGRGGDAAVSLAPRLVPNPRPDCMHVVVGSA